MDLVVDDYGKYRMKVPLSDSVILLTSKSISVLDAFIQTILKSREQCYVLEEDGKRSQSLADYNIDFIDDEFSKTSLGIEEYLSFFGLANRMFNDSFAKDIDKFLIDNNLQELKNKPLCELPALIQIKTRLFISKKRKTRLLILSNNNGTINDKNVIEIAEYVNSYCKEHSTIAIITTRVTPLVKAYKGELITL